MFYIFSKVLISNLVFIFDYPLVNKASREVANLTVRKNPHTPLNAVKEFVYLSFTNFDLNYLRLAKQNGINKI